MNKEEILEKSRNENKNLDLYEQEVLAKSAPYACIVAAVLATLFFIVQILVGGGQNYGLYAVVMSIPCVNFCFKAEKLRRKHEIVMAIGYAIFVLMLSAAHIYKLFSTMM